MIRAAGLLTFSGIFGIGKGLLFNRGSTVQCEVRISPNLEVFFRISLNGKLIQRVTIIKLYPMCKFASHYLRLVDFLATITELLSI
jgi:hypothetical protein